VAILGGAAFARSDPASTANCFHNALSAGINHLDVAPQYGLAQELLGPLIRPVRDQVFVACKTLRHNADGVRAQLEESLRLLECESFDLYQLHAVTDLAELDARRGAVQAILAARDEGLVAWVGITGHGHSSPAAQLEALRRYDLDTVMFPVYPRLWADPVYRREAEALLAYAMERDVGVMAIKAAASRPWAGREATADTWYEPQTSVEDVGRGVRFALSTPGVHAFCTPGDIRVLTTALRAAETYVPLSPVEREGAELAMADESSIYPMPAA
jgi:aryl-alcohol dehydrogenase-like predicted oxidoreductase